LTVKISKKQWLQIPVNKLLRDVWYQLINDQLQHF